MKVLNLTDINGRKIALAVGERSAVEVTQAGHSQAWHGVQANIRVTGGQWYEVRESVERIAAMLGSL